MSDKISFIEKFIWKTNLLLNPMMRKFLRSFKGSLSLYNPYQVCAAITYSCNKNCSYCYLNGKNSQQKIGTKKDMSLEDFNKLTDWIQSRRLQLILIGGEPTIHSKFNDFLEICKKKHIKISLATNGLSTPEILSNLDKNEVDKVIININQRSHYSDSEWDSFKDNLSIVNEMDLDVLYYLNIGAEFDDSDYEQTFDLISAYPGRLGLSLTAPHGIDLEKEKDVFLKIAKLSRKKGIEYGLVRPIPACMFTEDEYKEFNPTWDKYRGCEVCDMGPLLVNPDLSVIPCTALGGYGPEKKMIIEFDDLDSVINEVRQRVDGLLLEPLADKCKDCNRRRDATCQAGCLMNKIDN